MRNGENRQMLRKQSLAAALCLRAFKGFLLQGLLQGNCCRGPVKCHRRSIVSHLLTQTLNKHQLLPQSQPLPAPLLKLDQKVDENRPRVTSLLCFCQSQLNATYLSNATIAYKNANAVPACRQCEIYFLA